MKSLFLIGQTTAAALVLVSFSATHAASPTHFYPLDNTFADTLGGPSLVAHGGTLSGTGYSFGPSQGLSLSNALPSRSYTIDLSVSLVDTVDYRKLIDFKDLATDAGLYDFSSSLAFYPVTAGLLAINPDTPVRVSLSRDDATSEVKGYVNGAVQFSFTDTSGLAVFDGPQHIAHFLIDDFVSAQGEASAGHVDYIAIYGSALSDSDIAILNSTVPEPGALCLALAGLAMAGWTLRRR